jgi:hypothetical protein
VFLITLMLLNYARYIASNGIRITEKLAQVVRLLTCIREVSGSNLDRDIVCHYFLSSSL